MTQSTHNTELPHMRPLFATRTATIKRRFFAGSIAFGLSYAAAAVGSIKIFLAPFVACSLLHFWYDGFVWSVRKRQV